MYYIFQGGSPTHKIQVLIQKEKIDINSTKRAQISMLANKIDESYYHLGVQTNHTLCLFFIFSSLCSHDIADLIKKLELPIMVVSVSLKIKLGTPKFLCPKLVYLCRKQLVSAPVRCEGFLWIQQRN